MAMDKDFSNNIGSSATETLIFFEAFEEKCPHLGSMQDPATVIGYPNINNRCHRFDRPADVTINMQTTICFSTEYQGCPVFQQQRETQKRSSENALAPWTRKARPAAVIVPLILIIVAALIWWPSPGTKLEDNTSKAAPLQKSIAPAQSVPSTEPVAEIHSEKSSPEETGTRFPIEPNSSGSIDIFPDSAKSTKTMPADNELTNQAPARFRVLIYE